VNVMDWDADPAANASSAVEAISTAGARRIGSLLRGRSILRVTANRRTVRNEAENVKVLCETVFPADPQGAIRTHRTRG
jgi:hypothetical protein